MNPGALVRIYLPSFNRKELLVEALRSVERQTYPKWRLHLFDDASTDGAAEACAEFAARHPDRVEAVCLERNRGLNWTLNRFLALSQPGELLAFFSHDDIWHPERLAAGIAALGEDPRVGMSHSDSKLMNAAGSDVGQLFSDKWGAPPISDQFAVSMFRSGNFVCGPTVLARASAFQDLALRIPPSIRLSADYYMWLILGSQYEVRYEDRPLCRYRLSPGQMSSRFRETQREDFLIPQLVYRTYAALSSRISEQEARALFVKKARMYLHRRQLDGDVADAAWYGLRLLRLEPSASNLIAVARAIRGAQLARAHLAE